MNKYITGIKIPNIVSQAPLFVIPFEPRGIKIPVIPIRINAPAKISEYQVQYFIGL